MASPDTTQRAYTLRIDSENPEWPDLIWATHEMVNKGTGLFGDLLLSLRGGLDHRLAEELLSSASDQARARELRLRRVMLAMCWLSVEDRDGAPRQYIVPHDSAGRSLATDALRAILGRRGLPDQEIDAWMKDCEATLLAAIRDDAVWVNRSQAFDDLRVSLEADLDRSHARQMMELIFGGIQDFLTVPGVDLDDEAGDDREEDQPAAAGDGEDYSQKARSWLSVQWGEQQKSDFEAVAEKLQRLQDVVLEQGEPGMSGLQMLAVLANAAGDDTGKADPESAIAAWLGWKGRPSIGRVALQSIANKERLRQEDLDQLYEKLGREVADKLKKIKSGGRDVQAWAREIKNRITESIGMAYKTDVFSVFMDHACRRVSVAHSWIKLAEARRMQFEADSRRLDGVPEDSRRWLDEFSETRAGELGALGGYRIRRRAIDGWDKVVAAWSLKKTKTADDRAEAVKLLQDTEDKFGDARLFSDLAGDETCCVWQRDGKPDVGILQDYVAAHEARANQARFKVPMFRHPHALRHPVWLDCGNSRWKIAYVWPSRRDALKKVGRRLESKQNQLEQAIAGLPDEGTVRFEKAMEKVERLQQELVEVEQEYHRASDIRGLTLDVWDGKELRALGFRWHSKRLASDLGGGDVVSDLALDVSRADRLGRAAGGAQPGQQVFVRSVFDGGRDWPGRLQCPRKQLERLADHVDLHGWDDRALRQRRRLRWLITYSASLTPTGPWLNYREELGLLGKKWPHSDENKKRGNRVKLGLTRLPGLRVLSVDLGHRYAASCVVWQVVSADEVKRVAVRDGLTPPTETDFHWRSRGTGPDGGSVYRRIGPDVLPGGEEHPGPWARLDRQFVIRLQGEERDARPASETEQQFVRRLAEELGERAPAAGRVPVDDLMSQAVRIMRLGLRQHGDLAKLAWMLTSRERLLPGGRSELLEGEALVEARAMALRHWATLAQRQEGRVTSSPAYSLSEIWERELTSRFGCSPADLGTPSSRGERMEWDDARLSQMARHLESDRGLRELLSTRIGAEHAARDIRIRRHLRELRDWILPRGGRANAKDIRHVGGLSLTRIATIKSLYQVQKAYRTRPLPADPRANVPERESDDLRAFGSSILEALDKVRDNRVKQLVSRLVEGALGLGANPRSVDGRMRPRAWHAPADERFAPCQVIVIENLRHYRPEETRTRRENRQLMSWAAGAVRERLSAACELHGLWLREAGAQYTSRQCSRTGLPGLRCSDVPVDAFVSEAGYLSRRVASAVSEVEAGKGDAESRLLARLCGRWNASTKIWTDRDGMRWQRTAEGWRALGSGASGCEPPPIRIPQRGGELFVRADSGRYSGAALQADLNAAANVGLRDLLDPDWEGRWWYLPLASGGKLKADEYKGGAVFDGLKTLAFGSGNGGAALVGETSGGDAEEDVAKSERLTNAWCHPSTLALTAPGRRWQPYAEYWNQARYRVCEALSDWQDPPVR